MRLRDTRSYGEAFHTDYSWIFRRSVIRRRICVAATILSIGSISFFACEKDDDNDNDWINETDRSFTLHAAMSNTAEIRAGELASNKGTDPAVRAYGQMMVNDHTAVQTELKNLASGLGLTAPDSVDAAHAALAQQLQAMSGRAFDSMYIHSQIKDHDNAIDLFRNQTEEGNNWRLRDYAKKHLPHLQMHLNTADSISKNYP